MMQELKAQIDKGRQNLEAVIEETVSKARETARTEYQTALRREQSLSAELNRKKTEAMELNSAAVEYNNLKVEVSTRRGLLDELLRRQSETMVESRMENSRESNVIVVDAARRPRSAHRPLLSLNLGIGVFFGFFLGIVIAFLVEYLDRTIKTPEEIESILNLPVLGAIPDSTTRYAGYGYTYESAGDSPKEDNWADNKRGAIQVEQIPRLRPRHGVSEAYRSLRTALLLSSAEGLKVVAITSAGPEEGKTATAANLAIVMAQLGRNVLLVDADLRKPRVHQIFRVSNRSGLVHYLTGGTDLDSIILSTDIPRLFVTPAGPHPPNPSELLSSMRMQTFASLIRKREFDMVLIDCPPVLPVTDATLLGALADGMVLCHRAGVVLREDAITSTGRLRLAQIKILGAVLNAYRPQSRLGSSYQAYAEYRPAKKKGVSRSVA
jgi:capsular exopolysaccharide synthesis family protein